MDEDDFADEEWVDDESQDEDDLLACPSCGAHVHEETQQCPACGDWITPIATVGGSSRLAWIVVVAVVIAGLIAMTVL